MMKAFTGAIVAATMMALSVLGATQAEAACSPASGANTPPPGTTVTCSGSNAATYGDTTQSGLTINVQSGASVTSATGDGFKLNADNAVTNSGTIQSTFSSSGVAINSHDAIGVTNSGTISGVAAGIAADTGFLSVVNAATGTVTSGAVVGGATIYGGGAVSVANAGTISSGSGSTAVHALGNLTLTNTGSISSTGPSSTVVNAEGDAIINNSGSITNGAINIAGKGDVINSGTISLSNNPMVFGGGLSSVTNSGTISLGFIQFGGISNTLTLLPGSNITGRVLGAGSNTFQLGGTGAATFDTSTLGGAGQYQGFSTPTTRSAPRPGN